MHIQTNPKAGCGIIVHSGFPLGEGTWLVPTDPGDLSRPPKKKSAWHIFPPKTGKRIGVAAFGPGFAGTHQTLIQQGSLSIHKTLHLSHNERLACSDSNPASSPVGISNQTFPSTENIKTILISK